MKRDVLKLTAMLTLALGLTASTLPAADPPDVINYQGVLRDASNAPEEGSFDMIFRFFDAEVGGNEIVVDEHLAAGTGDVTVVGGLFNVGLGGGTVVDGAGLFGNDPYDTLTKAFGDFDEIWLQLEIDPPPAGGGFEVLSPRVRVLAGGYALNAANLGGNAPDAFGLRDSANNWSGANAFTDSGNSFVGDGSGLTGIDASAVTTGLLGAGRLGGSYNNALSMTNAANVFAGDGSGLTGVPAATVGGFGPSYFLNTSAASQSKPGDLEVSNLSLSAGALSFGGGATLVDDGLGAMTLTAGDSDSDRLALLAGNSEDDGEIEIIGGGLMSLTSGNGYFIFKDGSADPAPEEVGRLDFQGNLEVDGSVRVGSGTVFLDQWGANISAGNAFIRMTAGDSDLDDLDFRAGNSNDDGRLLILGDGPFNMYSGDGSFAFYRAATSVSTALLSNDGDLSLLGDLAIGLGGADVSMSFGSETLMWDASQTQLEFADDLALSGTLQTGSITSTTAYNRLGTGIASSSAVTGSDDLLVSGGLEVGGVIASDGAVVAGDLSPAGAQAYSSFGEGGGKDETQVSSRSDLYVADDIELDGTLYLGSAGIYDSTGVFDLQSVDGQRYAVDDDLDEGNAAFEWFGDGQFINSKKMADLTEVGLFRTRGPILQGVSFDLAESFLALEPLAPGDVVRVDGSRPDAVRLSDGTSHGVIGVVSSSPGFLLGGAPLDPGALRQAWGDEVHARFVAGLPTLRAQVLAEDDALGHALTQTDAGLRRLQQQPLPQGAEPSDDFAQSLERLQARRSTLENRIETRTLERFFAENFVHVALAGRVPVQVDAGFGAIEPGDTLVPGPTPGLAVRADGSGIPLGVALEPLSSGRGSVMTLVGSGGSIESGALRSIEAEQTRLADEIDRRTADETTGTRTLPGHFQVQLDEAGDDEARFSIFRDGADGLANEVFRVDEQGNVYAGGAFRPAAMDLAEYFRVSEPVGVGDLLVVDREHAGAYRRATTIADPAVVGIVSTEPGVLLGSGLTRIAAAEPQLAADLDEARRLGDTEWEAEVWAELERKFEETHAGVALSGTVPCNVDAGYGAIEPGDLLTTSPTAGHAMRAAEALPGTIVGKALETLEAGTGTIRVLVMLR